MGIFKKIGEMFSGGEKDENDYMANAEEFEKTGDYASAIGEYKKIIDSVYEGRNYQGYKHITKKMIECYQKMGDYEKVMELWKMQYHPADYTPKEMYELIKLLETAQKLDLVMKVYDEAGNKLLRNKVEFLMKQKKIPEANAALNDLLRIYPESQPEILDIWMMRAKLSMGFKRWEEANRYLNKILERNAHNEEARKLKDFCLKQVSSS